jgi:cobaltochelatase CobN
LITLLSHADTDVAVLHASVARTGIHNVRVVSLARVVDSQTLLASEVVVIRTLGGRASLPPSARDVVDSAVPLFWLDDDRIALARGVSDAELIATYIREGGPTNADNLLRLLSNGARGTEFEVNAPSPVPLVGIHGVAEGDVPKHGARQHGPTVALLFYRAHWLAGNLDFVDALANALRAHGCSVIPIFCHTLRTDPATGKSEAVELIRGLGVDAVVSTLSFATARAQAEHDPVADVGALGELNMPVIQAIAATTDHEAWLTSQRGLDAVDTVMNVAMPEIDGRIIGVPVCFKHVGADGIARYAAIADRVEAVARLASGWARLRSVPVNERRVAIVLGNSPARPGRIGNGVGLDTPASLLALLTAMRASGYSIGQLPSDSNSLMHILADQVERGDSTGLHFGNVYVGVQPPRGYDDDPSTYHSPDLPPTREYAEFYRRLRETLRVHAIVHLGKHGTLEWLPGKGLGLSAACHPERVLQGVPLVYPFIVNDPGEGTQAKRRTHAVVVDHLIPPLATAGEVDDLAELRELLDRYRLSDGSVGEAEFRDAAERAHVTDELLRGDDAPLIADRVEAFLRDTETATVRDGLHILGTPPSGEGEANLLWALSRVDIPGRPSLASTLADPDREGPAMIRALQVRDFRIESLMTDSEAVRWLCETVVPRLRGTTDEVTNVLRALNGEFVAPGASGSPSRGRLAALPTGRNFYSVDPNSLPTPEAWDAGERLAEALIARFQRDEGRPPRSVGLSIWGTSTMRTGGEDVAEALALMGVRPTWQAENGRVRGLEIIPLAELGRPRIDVIPRISGLFRDAFPNLIAMLNRAIVMVADLDEPLESNHVAAAALQRGLSRVFGSKPGAYGAGLLPVIDRHEWSSASDLASVFESWSAYAYDERGEATLCRDDFRCQFAGIDAAAKNQDNREHDILDSDDYFQFHGGMVNAVRVLRGSPPRAYLGDSSDPSQVRQRSLREEIAHVFRTRAGNPRWIAAMRRHGYKGAFEMAATVDYAFGYDATTGAVQDWVYEGLATRYVDNAENRRFLEENNPWALHGMAERLVEAIQRGLWAEPPAALHERLTRILLDAEGALEARSAPSMSRG